MTDGGAKSLDDRVLLLALTAKDSAITRELLAGDGIDVEVCDTFDELLHELRLGAGAIAVVEERLAAGNNARLAAVLGEQPAWSDLPVLLLSRHGADSAAAGDAVRLLGNVTLLERPLRITALLSALRSALRARSRQYQIRMHLEERERAADALRTADQRKDEFLATLGHELRNPLAPLVTGLHLLRGSAGTDPAVGRLTAIMERQLTHLVRLVDDLLEVSRITRGIVDVRHERVDLASLLRAAVDTTRPVFDAAHHRLAVELPSESITVSGDAVRLTQVFANLLTNAAKYTNSDGQVKLTARRAGDRVAVSVQDNGIGIAPADLESVFEMFMQVDRSHRRVQGGLGIGLTLVRSLVRLHGGTVQARSAGLGKGSEFVVTLPALVIETAGSDTCAEAPAALPSRRVLVVDDNCDAADTLGALLSTLGATVEVVHNGQAALDALPRFRPDTLLLDIGMPGMNGYEVAQRIRAMPEHAGTVLIALTGWGQDQDYRQSRLAGFDHHLVKPPDLEALRKLLAAVSTEASAAVDIGRIAG